MRKLREEGVDHSCFRLARPADRTTLRLYSPLCSIAYRAKRMYATVPNLRDDPPAAVLSVYSHVAVWGGGSQNRWKFRSFAGAAPRRGDDVRRARKNSR